MTNKSTASHLYRGWKIVIEEVDRVLKLFAALSLLMFFLVFLCPWIGQALERTYSNRFGFEGWVYYGVEIPISAPGSICDPFENDGFLIEEIITRPRCRLTLSKAGQLFLLSDRESSYYPSLEIGDLLMTANPKNLRLEAGRDSREIVILEAGTCLRITGFEGGHSAAKFPRRSLAMPYGRENRSSGGYVRVVTAACGLYDY